MKKSYGAKKEIPRVPTRRKVSASAHDRRPALTLVINGEKERTGLPSAALPTTGAAFLRLFPSPRGSSAFSSTLPCVWLRRVPATATTPATVSFGVWPVGEESTWPEKKVRSAATSSECVAAAEVVCSDEHHKRQLRVRRGKGGGSTVPGTTAGKPNAKVAHLMQ